MLLKFLPEDGEFKKALRDGGFTHDQWVAAETFNELARFRSSYHTIATRGEGSYEPYEILDARVEEMRAEMSAEDEEFRSEVEADMFQEFN